MAPNDSNLLSLRIKELRTERGITQRQLAADIGVSYGSVVDYENGRREPNSKAMVALERYFEVSGEYLRGEVDRNTFLTRSAEIHDELDCLANRFSDFSAEYRISNQNEQRLAISVLETTLDLLSHFVLRAGVSSELTEEALLRPLTVMFQLNPEGRAELLKRAAELTELSRYKS